MGRPLYKPLPVSIDYGGKRYRLKLTAANVLRYADLCGNPDGLSAEDITEVGFGWFVKTHRRLNISDKSEILDKIMHEYVNPPKRKLNTKKEPQAVVDFNYDCGYIYASFMQAYGIDLYEQAKRLHWCKFIELFNGLPDNCIIRQIMDIRGREIPVPNKYNSEEIQRLTELKAVYALPAKTDESETMDGWNKLFDVLERQVVNNG